MKQLLALVAAVALPLSAAGDFTVGFEKYRLQNGLRVILAQDNAVPVVAVYLIYGVGARSEEKGRSGFAHLFEHMMFQGSKNAPKGMHFQTVEANGGALNGSTHVDFTDYFEVLPSNQLAVALWLEADRMRGLNITAENLANQKEAVKQERRLTFDNRPYNTALVDRFPELAFRNWQNYHSLIGSFEDLNAATVEDVSKFFQIYYAPNNAVLAIAGDLRVPEAKKLVETYFGPLEPQPQPQHPDATEPGERSTRADVYRDPLARVPAVLVAWPGPQRRSPDYNAMVMLDLVLTEGDSSRLQQALVKGRQSVVRFEASLGYPFGGSSEYVDPGIYGVFLTHQPKVSGREVASQVEVEIAKIQKDGVPVKELDRARAQWRAYRLREMQNALNRAKLLAQYELLDGKPEWITAELDAFLSVTPAQVQAAAKKYLVPEKRVTLEIVPVPKEAK